MHIEFLNREELQAMLFQLEQAFFNHQQWHDSIIRSLVCRLPANRHDISPNAHKECRFGQWYYEEASEKLYQHPKFIELGEGHLQMHKSATKLLVAISNDGTLSSHDYDDFLNTVERVRLELSALQREFSVYNRDSLTGAISRINMLPVLREHQELVKRQVQLCSIVMLDLDCFKKINDQYGHAVGDNVLAAVSRFIIEHMRSYDRIFRIGGDEFLLCIQNANVTFAFEMIERIRTGIASMAIKIGKKELVHVTASFGLTSLEADVPLEHSIERADKALYKAKQEGRNCTRVL